MNNGKAELLERRRAFNRALGEGADAEIVMKDLAKFCYADMPTFTQDDPNGRIQAYKEGRREVYLRIKQYLNLTDAQVDSIDNALNQPLQE